MCLIIFLKIKLAPCRCPFQHSLAASFNATSAPEKKIWIWWSVSFYFQSFHHIDFDTTNALHSGIRGLSHVDYISIYSESFAEFYLTDWMRNPILSWYLMTLGVSDDGWQNMMMTDEAKSLENPILCSEDWSLWGGGASSLEQFLWRSWLLCQRVREGGREWESISAQHIWSGSWFVVFFTSFTPCIFSSITSQFLQESTEGPAKSSLRQWCGIGVQAPSLAPGN